MCKERRIAQSVQLLGNRLDHPGLDSGQGLEIFIVSTRYSPAVEPNQLPIHGGSFPCGWDSSVEIEVDHSPASSAEVKNE